MMPPERTLAILATEHRAARTPPSVERAVLVEFESELRVRQTRKQIRMAGIGAAIAAMLIMGVFVVRERIMQRPVTVKTVASQTPNLEIVTSTVGSNRIPATKPRPRKHFQVLHESPPQQSAGEPFVAIPYTVPLAPEERATVVRITLSPSAIAAVGFPLPAIDPGSDTLADVLVGEDGRAHAIRIVADSSFK